MNHVDLKYSGILSTRLDRFSVKANHPYRANLRCPICGDSQKSKTKARGWILEKDNRAVYYCHNCGASMSLRNFLKTVDFSLYNDYVIDCKLEQDLFQPKEVKPLDKLTMKRPEFSKGTSPLNKIKKVSTLKISHPVRKYIDSRAIPTSAHYKLYYAPKFSEWVNSLIPDKLTSKEEPRLVLPFIDEKGNLFGFTGRAFDPKSLRYLTIMLDDTKPKIFGLDTVNFMKRYFVVEGAIDSFFLKNAIAMAGADAKMDGLRHTENAVFVYDNEPRNKEIVRRMERTLDAGLSLCIWPEKVDKKDINDMILAGLDAQKIIESNIYSGLEGKLKLSEWRRA